MESVVFPIFTLLLGWLLSRAADHVRDRRAARSALNRAIADLLEIRFRLKLYGQCVVRVREIFPCDVPPAIELVLRRSARGMIGVDSSLADRYLRSVDVIAGCSPLLAYRMRGKEQVEKLQSLFPKPEDGDAAAAEFLLKVEDGLLRTAIPALEEAVVEVCPQTEWRLRREIRDLFRKPEETNPELDWVVAEAKAKIADLLRAASGKVQEATTPAALG